MKNLRKNKINNKTIVIIFFIVGLIVFLFVGIIYIKYNKQLDKYCESKYGLGFKHLSEPGLPIGIHSCYKIIDGKMEKYYFDSEEINKSKERR